MGKKILITGTSTGIGYHATEALCARGHDVWACLREPQKLIRLQETYPQNLHVIKLDVTSETDVRNAFAVVRDSLKDKNEEFILINNAGIAVGGPVEALSLSEWRRVFEVNFFAVIAITQIFLPLLRIKKGRVINISSISAHIASPFLGPYTSSKFALRALGDVLRREVAGLGVKVIAIEPGPVRTEIWGKSLRESHEQEKQLSPEIHQVYASSLKAIRSSVEAAARDAVPVKDVIRCLVEAVESPRPRSAYLVGRGIHVQYFLSKFLPTSFLDRLIAWGLRTTPKEY